jgi:hypothetical protein
MFAGVGCLMAGDNARREWRQFRDNEWLNDGDHVLDFRICVSPGPLVRDYYEGSGIVNLNIGTNLACHA